VKAFFFDYMNWSPRNIYCLPETSHRWELHFSSMILQSCCFWSNHIQIQRCSIIQTLLGDGNSIRNFVKFSTNFPLLIFWWKYEKKIKKKQKFIIRKIGWQWQSVQVNFRWFLMIPFIKALYFLPFRITQPLFSPVTLVSAVLNWLLYLR
jgi:hypothetical protein